MQVFLIGMLLLPPTLSNEKAFEKALAFVNSIESMAIDDKSIQISDKDAQWLPDKKPWHELLYANGWVWLDKVSGRICSYIYSLSAMEKPLSPMRDPLPRTEILNRVASYARLLEIDQPVQVFDVSQSAQWEETGLTVSFVRTHQGVPFDRSLACSMDIDWRSGRLLRFGGSAPVLPPADLAPRVTAEAARSTGLAGVFQIHKPSIVSEVIPHHLAIWQPNEPETSRRRRSFFSPEQAEKGRKGEGILAYVAQYANLDTYSERIGTYAWQYRAYVDAMTGRLLQMDFWFPMGGATDDDEEPSPFGWDLAPTRAKVGGKAVEGAAVAFVKHAKAGPKGGRQVVLSHGGLTVQAVYDAQRNLLATESRGVWAYGRPNEPLKAALSTRK